jgi:UDP-glucuronate decarboxylase
MARSLLLSTTPIRRSGLIRRNGVPDTTTSNGSASSFFSKQTLLVLGVGILFGYILLPVLMIEMNVEEAMEALPLVSIKYPGLQQQNEMQPKGSSIALRKTASAYEAPPSRSLEIDGTLLNGLNEAQKRLVEDHDVLSAQSLPTSTTPYIMKTAKLADHHRKKILVTGGAGFVGSHLVDKLMMEGHEVIVLDNFFTGQKKNVAHWLHHPNFSLLTHDVTEPITLEVDQIYHLACPASPPHYQYNPVKTIKTSTQGTLNMLGLAKRVRARILLTSTSEIYGDPQVHPQPESYWGNVNTIGPRSCYDEGKRVAETMMYSYKNQNGVEIRIARIFNTFGPRMHPNDGRVVSNFIIQALQNKDLTIYGEGKQTRSFQYVSDLVDGLHALMNGDYDSPVNLGNPEEYSIKEFAEYISQLTKTNSKIVKLAKSQDDPGQRRPDITTAKRELNWEPKVKVEKGLENTIAYFRKVLDEAGEIIPTGPGAAKPEA